MNSPNEIAEVISYGNLPDGHGTVEVVRLATGQVAIRRYAERGHIENIVDKREVHELGESKLELLTEATAHLVFDRIMSGKTYSSSFVFHSSQLPVSMERTTVEHKFCSTGIKFWRHQQQMLNYRDGKGHTVISTHISPEGACNLKCPYCSVTYRDTHSRIDLDVIKDYVEKLQSRGLKAIILTGGGEPTAYKHFNQLVRWLKYDRSLSIALITNGTLTSRVTPDVWAAFTWIRVSINIFDGWENRIALPVDDLAKDCVIGCSMVYTAEHQATLEGQTDWIELLGRVRNVAERCRAQYIRLLPNCALDSTTLLAQHAALEKTLDRLRDPRFFHQHKMHRTPKAHVCHQAYFRPYLSEEPWRGNGKSGAVYPCDSVVLNDCAQFFTQEYQICHAADILDFLDGKLQMKFDPTRRCSGCVFADNIDMLDDWKAGGQERFAEFSEPLIHEEFP